MPKVFSTLIVLFFFSQCSFKDDSSTKKLTIEEVSKELLKTPKDSLLLKIRRDLFLETRNWSGAILDQEQLFYLDTLNQKRRYDLAKLYLDFSDSNSSYFLKSYSLLNELNINFAPLFLLRGKQNYIVQNYQQSFVELKSYLRQVPNDFEAYYYKGLVYKEVGDIQMAKSQFQTAVEQNPNHIQSYIELGHIYSSLNDTLAQYYFENAVREDSSNIISLYNLAMYFQKHEKYSLSVDVYNQILEIDSNDIDANYNLGYIYLLERNFELALNYFEIVASTSTNNSSAYFAMGLTCKLLEKNEQAKLYFKKTLEIDPNFKEAKRELEDLK
ncbi:MAG: tetratricopeptide repeat protein [Bacteroidota bacterium]|nr:tetratricopeptide repeat protein [Bacteroidota bacterium]